MYSKKKDSTLKTLEEETENAISQLVSVIKYAAHASHHRRQCVA